MSGMDWIKLLTSYLDNPQLGRLPEHIQARFFKLYMLAGQQDANGLIPYSLEEISWKLHITMDELHETIDLLKNTQPILFCNNGNGPEIPVFRSEQVSRERREKEREDNRIRQERFREEHKRVSNALITPLESESESELESESESERESVSQATDDDILPFDRKTDICKHAGIPPKFSRSIRANPSITPDDILAELARNYSRKGKVKNPGYITGLNLGKVLPEKAAVDWYDLNILRKHLPGILLTKLRLAFQSRNDDLDNWLEETTRKSEIEDIVDKFLGRS